MRLAPLQGSQIAILTRCITCLNEWNRNPTSSGGCPKCSDTSLSNEIIDRRLAGRPIKRRSEYMGYSKPMEFECLVENCGHIWKANPGSVCPPLDSQAKKKNPSGCLLCSGKSPLDNDIMDERLKGRNITRKSDYVNVKTHMKFQCDIETCQHEWYAAPTNVIGYNQRGCPKCPIHWEK